MSLICHHSRSCTSSPIIIALLTVSCTHDLVGWYYWTTTVMRSRRSFQGDLMRKLAVISILTADNFAWSCLWSANKQRNRTFTRILIIADIGMLWTRFWILGLSSFLLSRNSWKKFEFSNFLMMKIFTYVKFTPEVIWNYIIDIKSFGTFDLFYRKSIRIIWKYKLQFPSLVYHYKVGLKMAKIEKNI